MKGREGKGPPPADLLVCFPTRRAHLSLMPKPICSPARPSDPATRHNHHRRHHSHHHNIIRNSTLVNKGHASPLLWANNKTKSQNSDLSEPTSPKVTCAGQIKVRPKPGSCKNWQSVMEEIERMHNSRKKQRKRSPWTEALGFKKDVMQFLTCLRNIRFDFRCFGSFPAAAVISSDDEEDDDEEEDEIDRLKEESEEDDRNSGAVFSKWFMILQENHEKKGKMTSSCLVDEDDDDKDSSAPPPPPANALLLMRCRSAPAKSWVEEREEEEREEAEAEAERKQGMVVMRCGTEFSKLSDDIAKETWVVGGIKDMLSRSRSSRR